MKVFIFYFLILNSYYSTVCNNDLLYSYGISTPQYVTKPSVMCGGEESDTCCINRDESSILFDWNNDLKNNLFTYLEGNIWLTKSILNYYEDLIVLGKYIYLSPKSSRICKQSAEELVQGYIFKEEMVENMKKFEKFIHKFKNLRKGFYCALCSVRNQKFFNSFEKKTIYSYDFCEYLVENSVEEIYYRSNKILPILKLITVVLDCKDGEESQDNFVIRLKQEQISTINVCRQSFQRFRNPLIYMDKCLDYCKNFSLTFANDVLDGNLNKLDYVYRKIIASNLKSTDPLFEEIDGEEDYLFSEINPIYFGNKLSFQDIQKYEVGFEPFGIDLHLNAEKSLYNYGQSSQIMDKYKKFISLLKISIMTLLLIN